MKKNAKRILAISGVILLILVFILFMAAAVFGDSNLFRGALGTIIILPILLYAMLLVYNYLKKKNPVSSRKIDSIIFDVGNVLLAYDWEGYLKSFHFPKEEYDTLSEVIFKSKTWQERDRGALPEEAYVDEMISQAPQYEKDIRLVMKDSSRAMKKLDYADSWISFLKSQNYRLYILSNYSKAALEETSGLMTFLKSMNDAIFSCEVKEIKPEDAIFLRAIRTFNLIPERSVFIDDREENCEAARRNGIQAIHFKDFKQAANDLEKILE